jgi:hypothetical protein
MSARITLKFVVPLTARPGDYARLYSNNGDGDVDFTTPMDNEKIELFPNGSGNYGWGLAPWGNFPWGQALSIATQGWGLAPWGLFPWGYGAVVIIRSVQVEDCGNWQFAFQSFDALGNVNIGTPGVASAVIHIAPPAPAGLKKVSYDPETGDLTLAVVDQVTQQRMMFPSRINPLLNTSIPSRIGIPLAGGITGTNPALPSRAS